jgi:hypothetical protein
MNGYRYLPPAWTDADIEAYDWLPCYDGHAAYPRSAEEEVGWFQNTRRRANGCPEADLYLHRTHPLTPYLIYAARHDPSAFALSHVAHGVLRDCRRKDRNIERVVVGFKKSRGGPKILCVDVIKGCGGTTAGLFDAHRREEWDSL